MKTTKKLLLLPAILANVFIACNNDDNIVTRTEDVSKKDVIENYANIVYSSYKESYDSALEMQLQINQFVENPTQEGFESAKSAWLEARDYYGQTEVFRGSNGPVDFEGDETWAIANEGQLNAWPLNEAYIDYVSVKNGYTGQGGIYDNSIIAGTDAITKETLGNKNEDGGNDEKAISTGWHAIEFLLWGQDETNPADKIPGQRPYTDYVIPMEKKNVAAVNNHARRGTYLKVVTELLVDDLKDLVDTWAEGGAYRDVFLALDENEALKNIILGPHFLASEELSFERMLASATSDVGIDNSGQEDEHSCFSDNTHRDVYMNAKGILNVLFGEYEDGGIDTGASVYELVKQVDPVQAAKLKTAIDAAWAAIVVVDNTSKSGTPYDLMIVNESEQNPGIVLAGHYALKTLGDVITESAQKFDIGLE